MNDGLCSEVLLDILNYCEIHLNNEFLKEDINMYRDIIRIHLDNIHFNNESIGSVGEIMALFSLFN